MTVRVGLACTERDELGEDLYRRADGALYAAKGNGRNRPEPVPATGGRRLGILRVVSTRDALA
ncbi:hypothetical protein [Methylobacterium sp. WL64]|uniref:hypothetical protein n=1 Tax=Methylobacterium sp. WL64 TaxID=2603894 RepID=UPI00164F8271